jgi:hypothetical protein
MSVNIHRHCTAITVAKPVRNRGNIDAAFDAAGCEKVTQVVKRYSADSQDLYGSIDGFLAFGDSHNFGSGRLIWPLDCYLFQQGSHIRDHRDFTAFPGMSALQTRRRVALEHNFAAVEIAISPRNVSGFVLAKAAVREELSQVSGGPGKAAARASDFRDQLLEFSGGR